MIPIDVEQTESLFLLVTAHAPSGEAVRLPRQTFGLPALADPRRIGGRGCGVKEPLQASPQRARSQDFL